MKKIPTTLSELTFGEFIHMVNLCEKHGDEEMLLNNLLVEYITGIPFEKLNEIPKIEYDSILASIQNLLSEKPGEDITPVFKHNGQTFGFVTNFSSLSFGEYIDIDNYTKDRNDWHKVMAVLYRPVVEVKSRGFWKWKKYDRYEIEKYTTTMKYSEIMKGMPADIAMTAMLFFYHIVKDLLTNSINYLTRQLEKEKKTQKRLTLQEGMDGIQVFINQLEEGFSILMPLKNLTT